MTLSPGRYHCLSVWQPWAWAIFHGKPIENRNWPTPYRGRLLIHSAKNTSEVEEVLRLLQFEFKLIPPPGSLIYGCILGFVELHACTWSSTRSTCGWGAPGCYHWHLRNPVLLDSPIPYRGLQRIFPIQIGEAPAEPIQRSLI
jgi:hypothetical protein